MLRKHNWNHETIYQRKQLTKIIKFDENGFLINWTNESEFQSNQNKSNEWKKQKSIQESNNNLIEERKKKELKNLN